MPPEKSSRAAPAPRELPPRNEVTLQKFKLYLRPNLTRWIIRPYNFEEFSLLDTANTDFRGQFTAYSSI